MDYISPDKKAKEIIFSFIVCQGLAGDITANHKLARYSGYILVDSILNELQKNYFLSDMLFEDTEMYKYWISVKIELENYGNS